MYYFIRKLIQGLIIFNYVRLSFGQNQFNEEEGDIIKKDIKLLMSNLIEARVDIWLLFFKLFILMFMRLKFPGLTDSTM